MKSQLTLLFCLFSAAVFAGEALPEYQITKNVIDKSLSPNEAVVTFYFSGTGSRDQQQNLVYAVNGKQQNLLNQPKVLELKLKAGKYVFDFYVGNYYSEITTDSIQLLSQFRMSVNVNFHPARQNMHTRKPVIYVYPQLTTQVNIQLELKGEFSFTYPQYKENGWNFVANPDGKIVMDKKEYEYLFWDGITHLEMNRVNWNEGFVIEKKNLVAFFEEKLNSMSLNHREAQDFITYWVPEMNVNEKNYIHFLFNEEFNYYANMTITPKPDQLFRVYMIWCDAAKINGLKPVEQKIPSLKREGFTVIEWGGAELEKWVNS